jgi:hypothetical protein
MTPLELSVTSQIAALLSVTNYAPRVINYAPRVINYAPTAVNYAYCDIFYTGITQDDCHMTMIICFYYRPQVLML